MASHDNYPTPKPLTLAGVAKDFLKLGNDLLRTADRVLEECNLAHEVVRKDYTYPDFNLSLIFTNGRVIDILVNEVSYAKLSLFDNLERSWMMCYNHLVTLFFVDTVECVKRTHES